MLLVFNHKMNMSKEEIINYKEELETLNLEDEIIVCPSNIHLSYYSDSKYKIGAQDVSVHDNGAYTGDTSASQLKSVGSTYCIVGHSERRKYHQEDSALLNKKLSKLLENNLIPILCIGESLEQKEQGLTNEILLNQIEEATKNLSNKENIIIAYEPIWAIGTGITPTKEEIETTIEVLKTQLSTNYKFLYGGSVNKNNVAEFKTITNLNGFLIGGLGLKINEIKEAFL